MDRNFYKNCIIICLPNFLQLSLLLFRLNQKFQSTTKIVIAKSASELSFILREHSSLQKLLLTTIEIYDSKKMELPSCKVMAIGEFSASQYDYLDDVDDFVFTSATVEEIVFRIGKILNRKFRLLNGEMEFHLCKNFVEVNRRRIRLSIVEHSLLKILFLQAGRWFSAKQLSLMLENKIAEASISVMISRLRVKLGQGGKFLMTQRGMGYSFVWKE